MNIKHSVASAAYLILAFMAIWLAPTETKAQVTYETFIYTSDALSSEIQDLSNERAARGGYMADLGMAMANAGKGIAGGYVTSFIDMGVNAIASLITRPSRLKNEWEETVKAESTFETKFGTMSELNDFYSVPSTDGAMDPRGMRFNGIGCLRRGEKGDTVFYISCHVDHSKLYRIVNHSKFELVLDTLILCPKESNLPNSSLPLPFYFSERGSYQIDMTMTLTSSWINELTVLQKDKELGRFELTVPIDSSQVAADGKYRYVRGRSKGSPLGNGRIQDVCNAEGELRRNRRIPRRMARRPQAPQETDAEGGLDRQRMEGDRVAEMERDIKAMGDNHAERTCRHDNGRHNRQARPGTRQIATGTCLKPGGRMDKAQARHQQAPGNGWTTIT